MQLHSALKELGLDTRETKVYTTLLSLGKATVLTIAGKSSIKRSTVYDVLERLREQDLVLKIPHAKKQLFMARDPREFVEKVKRKADVADSILPSLLALTHNEGKANIFYYEGLDGLIESHVFLMKEQRDKELVGFFAYSPDTLPRRFANVVEKTFTGLGDAGVHIRGIFPDHPSARRFEDFTNAKGYTWEAEFIDIKKYKSLTSFMVYGDVVLITSRQMSQNIIIENADIADTQRQVFNLLWEKR